ncbi:MAG TPA: glycosyltransferase family 2 protein, partial [Gaiellaceae bacterium]|nr:glycosyltransferase family 2 protein [Gaiellaceae bacterium]
MKLVMTLLVRDEADILDAQIAFHLNAGVDFVIATDNASRDGTTEILESYARDGYLHLIREEGEDMRQGERVTRMARLAATDFDADWVINSDADEFWCSHGAPINDPTSFYRPVVKVAHRADPHVVVGRGNHALVGSSFVPLTTWHPI